MTVNGETGYMADGMTLLAFLQSRGFTPDLVAVERNGQIVPRAAFASTQLDDGDVLEIVQFVGGG